MINCNSCGNDNPDDALECLYCGQSFVGSTILPNVVPSVATPVQNPKVQIGSSGGAAAISVLIPLDQDTGIEDPVRAIQLPTGYFDFLVGRTDMDAGVVPQIDLLRRFPDWVETPQGYLVSKRTAKMRRDQITGIVYLMHHQESHIEILVRHSSSPDPIKLMPGEETQLDRDDHVFLGKNDSALEFVVK